VLLNTVNISKKTIYFSIFEKIFNMMKTILFSTILLFVLSGKAQNTVGVINNTSQAYNGYTLFNAHTETFLINNCGQVVRQWTSTFVQGNSVYLLENGNLLRTGNTNSTDIVFGGQGGVIELYNWEGTLIWQYYYDTPQYRQNHDIFPLPNGNILILAAKVMTNAQAIQAGRNPALLPQSVLYSQQIVEVQPVGTNQGTIVWEWDIKDHLIQDFDATKDNFGVVSQNPNKLNVNFTNGGDGSSNWLHVNSVQYNLTLNQIILSSRNLSEIWIIDHSTTTAQAATGSGGLSGKGGDLIYRWGNPQAYNVGTAADRKLYGQHYPHWIADGLLDAGKIIVFNNGRDRQPQFSEVFILNPPTSAAGVYVMQPGGTFGPQNPDYIFDQNPLPTPLFTAILGGANRLPNGNILICAGSLGALIEIDNLENIVWRYVNPVNNATGVKANQGGTPPAINALFRGTKYSPDYPAFIGKDLTAGSPIELNSGINAACSVLAVNKYTLSEVKVTPNPTSGLVKIAFDFTIDKIEVYTILGAKISTVLNLKIVDLSGLPSGIYLLKIFVDGEMQTKKVIKH
jgi:hypothetical protein